MSNRDPFELLVALNPVPALSERTAADDAMLTSIIATAPVAARRSRRRRLWFTGGAVVVVTVGLAAFAFLRQESPSNPLQLACYPSAVHPPASLFDAPMSTDPIASCAVLWTDGRIASDEQPPQLTACVLDTGIIAVIPGDQRVCAELGLANWVGELSDGEVNLLAFQDALVAGFGDRCVTEGNVEAEVRAIMAEFGVADWEILLRGGYTPTRQCSAVTAAAEEQVVVIASRRGTPESP